MNNSEQAKQVAADFAAKQVESGQRVGLGTGSTTALFIASLAQRVVAEGLDIEVVVTSEASLRQAQSLGLTVASSYPEGLRTDLLVDGADRVDAKGNLLKGGGGALFREKLVALESERYLIVVDETKHRDVLDDSFPVPVEVLPFGHLDTKKRLEQAVADVSLRYAEDGMPFVTDGGHYIYDCLFPMIADPEAIHLRLKSLPGVLETGLFIRMLPQVITGKSDGEIEVEDFSTKVC